MRKEEVMFEHLDDASPPEPTSRTLGSVRRRAAVLRRRHVRGAIGASTAALIILAVVIAVVVVPSGRATEAFASFDSQTGLLAPGTAVPPANLSDVVFIGPLHGFALVLHAQQTLLAASADGGQTWVVVDPELPTGYPSQIEFADAEHGYLWGGPPSAGGTAGLWTSADGGRTWSEEPIGPVVSDVSAIGPDVWAVVGSCPITARTTGLSCPLAVDISIDDGATWSATAATPPLSFVPTPALGDQGLELARITRSRAYLLSYGPTAAPRLIYTADDGQSWVTRVDPCPGTSASGQQVAASATTDLWMLCGSVAGAGSQAKELFRSQDGGQQWDLAASASTPGLVPATGSAAGSGLPTVGYVSPYSLGHENLAVLTAATAWLFPDGSEVFHTSDGGSHWSPLTQLVHEGFVVGGRGNVVFATDSDGWVSETGTGLWHTTDGVDWTRLG